MKERIKKQAKELRDILGYTRSLTAQTPLFHDISLGEARLLDLLFKSSEAGKRMTPSDISQQMNISRPAASRLIGTVEEKGLVERDCSKPDRRIFYLKLTGKGHELLLRELSEYEEAMEHVIERMGEEQMQQYLDTSRLLHKLLAEELMPKREQR